MATTHVSAGVQMIALQEIRTRLRQQPCVWQRLVLVAVERVGMSLAKDAHQRVPQLQLSGRRRRGEVEAGKMASSGEIRGRQWGETACH